MRVVTDGPWSGTDQGAPILDAGLGQRIRRTVLEQSKRANVGHIGSCLSVADIVAAVYGGGLQADDPHDDDRDRFILSKGHAALSLYAALVERGVLDAAELDTFCGDDSALGVHPERHVPGIDFSTGSLGHGLGIATGAALAARMQGSGRQVVALLSDAECNAGSVWEAAMFAGHHGLANLVAIVDQNGQQALGHTDDILRQGDVGARWRSLGWEVVDADGHDAPAMVEVLRDRRTGHGRPRVVLAVTTFGKGVSFMERQIKWHYMPMSDAEYGQALAEIDACATPSSAR